MRAAFVLLALLAAGCMSTPKPPAAPPGTLRFLALGDSYTIGEGVAPADRWPVQLAALLRAEGVAVAEPEIVATTGWTVAELDAAIDAADPHGPFDVVTLLIGVNDEYRGGTVEAYRPAFRTLLARAVGLAGNDPTHVVVLSIPDWGVTPFGASSGRDPEGIARALEAFNAAARDETSRAGARWVDPWAVSREMGATAVVADGLHPSGALYARWAALALPEARASLRK